MSLLKANAVQLGQSLTANQNFTWYQPATPDGTVRLGNGNSGSVTDLVTLTSAGNLGIGTSSPAGKLDIRGASASSYIIDTTAGSAVSSALYLGVPSVTTYAGLVTDYANDRFYIRHNSATRMTLDSSGNLGLGVTPNAWHVNFKALQTGNNYAAFVGDGSNGYAEVLNNCYASGASTYNYVASLAATRYSQQLGSHKWYIAGAGSGGSAISFTQAMTLDASGNLLVGTTSAPASRVGLVVRSSTASSSIGNFYNDSTTPYGCFLNFSAAAPNNSTNWFLYGSDSSANRFFVYSNGGIANYSANNTNLSDARLKTAITPAPSWLAKINAIEVVNFKYKDQTHEDPNLGVIAQQVLSVAPELVDESGFGETPKDGVPLMAIFETDLKYAMLKAIQELSAELNELKKRIN